MNNDQFLSLDWSMAGRTDQCGSPTTERMVLHGFLWKLSSLEDAIYQVCIKSHLA